MPTPKANVTFRPELAALAYLYAIAASMRGFIGLNIMPVFEVPLQAAVYPVIPAEAFLKLPETARAARSAYGRGDYEFEDGNYFCKENGWEEPIDDSERKLYQRFFDAEVVATERAVDIILRKQEKRIAAKVQDATALPTGAVGTKWSTLATASPRSDVKAKVKAMRDSVGLEPTGLAISWQTFQNILMCAELKDYLKYTTPYLIDTIEGQKKVVAQYLGLQEVQVGNAIYDSAKKGQKLTPANIWDDAKGTLYVGSQNLNDLRQPTLGRTFLWTDDTPENLLTESYREEQIRSDVIRVRQYTDEAYVCTSAGYVLTNLA